MSIILQVAQKEIKSAYQETFFANTIDKLFLIAIIVSESCIKNNGR